MYGLADAITTLISNMIALSIIPILWWVIKCRKETPFTEWIGLYPPKLESKFYVLIIFLVVYLVFYTFDYTIFITEKDLSLMEGDGSNSTLYGLGWSGILYAFITNFLANGFCEELFFRGFIAKRLLNKFGLYPGLVLQAIPFGLIHNLIWLISGTELTTATHIVLFSFTSVAAFLLGFINEKIYNGSFIPSFILHGLGNFYSALRVLFLF